MASINGLTVKKLKYFEGKEGAAAQGDLYLGNKKIGILEPGCRWLHRG